MGNLEEKRFDGQVAIVTGAGAGMGRAHAKLLAKRGASVVVNDLSKSAEETVQQIIDDGGSAVVSQDDVSTEEGASSIVDTALKNFNRIDILVSNAAITKNVPFSEMTKEEFDRIMRVNVYGSFFVTKAVWPHFVKQNYGKIILVSSNSAYVSQPNISHYAASKGAIIGLGKSLAKEGEEFGIAVNILAPGAFTSMMDILEDEEQRKQMKKLMPVSLVSPTVAWLAHRDNTLNGEIIESASGRAASVFIGATKGYWNEELTVEDLFENQEKLLSEDGAKTISNFEDAFNWQMIDNTGWDK